MDFRTELSKLIAHRKDVVESFNTELKDLHFTGSQEDQIRSDLKLMELIRELYDKCNDEKNIDVSVEKHNTLE